MMDKNYKDKKFVKKICPVFSREISFLQNTAESGYQYWRVEVLKFYDMVGFFVVLSMVYLSFPIKIQVNRFTN